MGDVKLALFMGAMLGKTVAVALMLGMVFALVPSLFLLAKHGSKARKMGIPLPRSSRSARSWRCLPASGCSTATLSSPIPALSAGLGLRSRLPLLGDGSSRGPCRRSE